MYRESMAGPGKTSDGAKIDDSELQKLRKQDYWLQFARAKLLMDLIFVCTSIFPRVLRQNGSFDCAAYEVFNLKPARDVVKTITGLLSAVLR